MNDGNKIDIQFLISNAIYSLDSCELAIQNGLPNSCIYLVVSLVTLPYKCDVYALEVAFQIIGRKILQKY